MVSNDNARLLSAEEEEMRSLEQALREAQHDLPDLLPLGSRRSAFVDALIPRVVPSIATYGAYEKMA